MIYHFFRKSRSSFCVAVSLLLMFHPSSLAKERNVGSKVNINSIFQSWRARQKRIHKIDFSWIQERTYTKYWANCHVPDARHEYLTLRFKPSRLVLQDEKIRFDSGVVDSSGDLIEFDGSRHVDGLGRIQHDDARRVFRDDRIRYDKGRRRVDPRDPIELDWPRNLRAFSLSFDGKQNQQFLPSERKQYAEAYIFREQSNIFKGSLYYRPLVLTYRPFWLNLDPKQFSIVDEKVEVNGYKCWVLVDRSGLGRTFWVDPSRDFLICRYQQNCDILGARMKTQIDITFSPSKSNHWVPTSWKTIFFDNNGLMEQYALALVTEAKVNMPVTYNLFQLEYPSETWVFDENTKEHSIFYEKNKTRPITLEELNRGASYDQLLSTQENEANLQGMFEMLMDSIWLQLLMVTLILMLLLIWIHKRFQPRKSTDTNINA